MKTSTLIFSVVCFTLGVVLGTVFKTDSVFSLFLVLLGGVLALLPRMGVALSRVGFFVSLFLLAFGCGLVRIDFTKHDVRADVLNTQIKETITLEGIVIDEPDERDDTVRLRVETLGLRDGDTFHAVNTRVLLTVPLYPTWHYGDRIVFEGVLEKPKRFVSDTGRSFDYAGYLSKDGIYYQMFRPKMTLVKNGQGNKVRSVMFDLKYGFLEKVSLVLHEPYAALAGGLIVGAKQSLGEGLLADFRTVGLIHIVVLSGYNVTIVAESLMRVISFLPGFVRVLVGTGSIILFTIMTGAGATVVRASIMAMLVVVGRALGRDVDLLRLLAIAGLAMIMHNPLIVVHDPSFQLSFLATLGLFLMPALFEKKLRLIPERFGLREIVVATIATQIFVLPVLVYMMGSVSLVALITNILVLPIIPLTMLLGFLVAVFGFVSRTLSAIFAFFAFLFLYYEVAIVELFAKLPFASMSVPAIPLWVVVLWYVGYGVLLWKVYRKSAKRS